MKRSCLAPLVGSLLLTLAACGGGATAAGGGTPAPTFSVQTIDGAPFNLTAQRGKPVVVYFYASWCGTCVAGATTLGRFHAAHPAVAVLALDVDPANDAPAAVAQFRRAIPDATYPFAIDMGDTVTKAYGVKALEESVVISPAGTLAFHNTTSPTLSLLDQELAKVTQG